MIAITLTAIFAKNSSMQTYSYSYPITLGDIDTNYTLTINAILCYFQDTISRFLATGHVAPFDIKKQNLIWMITEFYASLQERKPLWSENIRVEVWISELSPIKVFVDFTMKDDKNVVFAKGTSTWLLVDVQTRKPYPCHNLENLVKLHDEHDAIRHTKIRMEKGTTELNTISHNVSPVEIDFNGHTNNQNYVRLVVSLVPSHFIESHNLVDFHIKYAQETFLGDKLIATLQEYGETCLSCDIRKATDQSLVCEISSHWEHR